jgi:membrane-associated phospholipid phosphatase
VIIVQFWALIADLGDSGLLGVMSFAAFLCLYLQGAKRAAIAVILAYVLTVALISVQKLFFALCVGAYSGEIHSPSGHTALSVAVYSMIVSVWTLNAAQRMRIFALGAALLLSTSIAISRVRLGAHTITEVEIGYCTGVLVVWINYFWFLKGAELPQISTRYLLLSVLFALLVAYGLHTPSESVLQRIAEYLREHYSLCRA